MTLRLTSRTDPQQPRPQRTVLIDPRTARFAAGASAVMLALALLGGTRWGVVPLAIHTFVLAWATVFAPRFQPYGYLYSRFVASRLSPARLSADYRPLQFATALALVTAVMGLITGLLGMTVLYVLIVGTSLAFAAVHAVRGVCVPCQLFDGALQARARVNDELRDVSVRL